MCMCVALPELVEGYTVHSGTFVAAGVPWPTAYTSESLPHLPYCLFYPSCPYE